MSVGIGKHFAARASEPAPGQRRRREQFQVAESVDVHCHCLPGLDDGPETMDDALRLCRALVADGVTTAVGVAHQLGRYEGRNGPAEVRRNVEELQALLNSQHVPLRVLPGGDVRIDERIPEWIVQDRILTIGDAGKYLLLELPHEFCIDPMPLVQTLREMGIESILTHPERCPYLTGETEKVLAWVREGIHLQITAGSLTGDFGVSAREAGWYWLQRGAVAMIASDAHHATHRPPRMSEAISAVASCLGPRAASIVCLETPLRVIEGRSIRAALENESANR